jgi:hypothetical protein
MITAVVLLTGDASLEIAQKDFTKLGFEVTPVEGGSLLISGQESMFARQFGAKIESDPMGGVLVESEYACSRKLPLNELSNSMQDYVIAIEFEEPIEFGPVDF